MKTRKARMVILFVLAAILFGAVGSAAAARPERFTFPNVEIDGAVFEVEVTTKKNYTHCGFFEDDYAAFVGWYAGPVGPLAEGPALDFCLSGFPGQP